MKLIEFKLKLFYLQIKILATHLVGLESVHLLLGSLHVHRRHVTGIKILQAYDGYVDSIRWL